MQIFLTEKCESLKGTLGRGFGYYIRGHLCYRSGKMRFYSQRSKHAVPPDGHWKFIVQCAELAQIGLHVKDIKVPAWELADALYEANIFIAERQVRANIDRGKDSYNARDILNLKITFGL